MILFDFLSLLIFELGQSNFAVRAAAYSLNPMTAVVILTVRRGFGDCMSIVTPRSTTIPNLRTVVYSGTPLLRVLYRDSETAQRHSFVKNALTNTSASGVTFFLVLFCRNLHDSRFLTLNGEITALTLSAILVLALAPVRIPTTLLS